MAELQYIGARYVPKFFEGASGSEWLPNTQYEALTVITRNGNSYTSKIPVPASVGAPENNAEYWVSTGVYNQQIEAYRQEVNNIRKQMDTIDETVEAFENEVNQTLENFSEELDIHKVKNIVAGFMGRFYYPGTYQSSQGCCIIPETNYLFVAQFDYSGQTNCKIVKYDYKTGSTLQESGALPVGHCNSLSYNPITNEIITDSGYVIDPTALTIKRHETVNSGNLICDEQGKFYSYSYSSVNQILTFNILNDDLSINRSFALDLGVENPVAQQITVYKNYAYLAFSQPAQIYMVDINAGKLVKVIDVDKQLSSYYPLGELSTINFINDNYDFVITGKPRAYNPLNRRDEVGGGVTSVGYGNLISGTPKYTIRHPWSSVGTFGDGVAIGNTYHYRPTGLDDAPMYPFDLAILIQSDFKYGEIYEINLLEDTTIPLIFSRILSQRGINMYGHHAPSAVLTDSTLRITNGIFDDAGSAAYVLNLYNGNYVLDNISFPNASNENVNYGLNSRNLIRGVTPATGYTLNIMATLETKT